MRAESTLQSYLSSPSSDRWSPEDKKESLKEFFQLSPPPKDDGGRRDNYETRKFQAQQSAHWGRERSDELLAAIIELDSAMAQPNPPSASLRFALDHPMGMAGMDIAKQAFSRLGDCVTKPSEADVREERQVGIRAVPSAWSHLSRVVASARSTLGAIGFDAAQSEALLSRAFSSAVFAMVPNDDAPKTTKTLRALAGFVTDPSMPPGTGAMLGSNGVVLALAVGDVGSWSFDQGMVFGQSESFGGLDNFFPAPRIVQWASSVLGGLERGLDFSNPSSIDSSSLRKISALVAFSDKFRAAYDAVHPGDSGLGEEHPLGGSIPQVRALAEKFSMESTAGPGGPSVRKSIDDPAAGLGDKLAAKRGKGEPDSSGLDESGAAPKR